MPFVKQKTAAGNQTPLDISSTYVTTPVITGDYTITSYQSIAIPVDSSLGPITITPNTDPALKKSIRFRVHDIASACGNNPVHIGAGGSLGKLNTAGGAIEFAWTGISWVLIDKFENIWDRDEVTNRVTLNQSGQQLIASELRSGDPGEVFSKTAAEDFINPEANVDQGASDWGNALTFSDVSSAIDYTDGVDFIQSGMGGNIAAGSVDSFMEQTVPASFQAWVGNGDIIIDLGVSTFIDAVLYGRPSNGNHSFFSLLWLLQGSNDNITYSTILDPTVSPAGGVGETVTVDLDTPGSYRYIKFNGQNANLRIGCLALFEITPLAVSNAFEVIAHSGSSKLLVPSTLALKDENQASIVGAGKINIAYTVNGGAYSSFEDYDAFTSQPATYLGSATEVKFKFQAVGSQRLRSLNIESAATYMRATTAGVEVVVNSETVAEIKDDGTVIGSSGKFGLAATVTEGSVANTDFTNIGGNVDQGANDYGNGSEQITINSASASSEFGAAQDAAKGIDGDTGTYWQTSTSGPTPRIETYTLVLGSAQIVDRVRIFGHNTTLTPVPKRIDLIEGWNGASWETIDATTYNLSFTVAQWLIQDFTNTTAYDQYRFTFANTTVNYISFQEIELYAQFATSANTFDFQAHSGSSTTFSPVSFKAYNENDALINGTGKVNVDYALNGGAFTNTLVDQDTFKALASSIFSSLVQLDLRVQPMGDIRISRISISTPENTMTVNSDGSINIIASGEQVVNIKSDGSIEGKSGKFGTQAETFTADVTEWEQPEANVDQGVSGWGNGLNNIARLGGDISGSSFTGTFQGGSMANLIDNSTGTTAFNNSGGTGETFEILYGVSYDFGRLMLRSGTNDVSYTISDITIQVRTSTGPDVWTEVYTGDNLDIIGTGVSYDFDFTPTTGDGIRVTMDDTGGVGFPGRWQLADVVGYESVYATTTNTFQHRILTAGDPASYAPSTFTPKDEADANLVDSTILVAYSTDGISFSSQYSLSAFQALPSITSDTFWLEFEMVGDKKLGSYTIETPTTTLEVNSLGEVIMTVDGQETGRLSETGPQGNWRGATVPDSYTTTERNALSPDGPWAIFNTTTSKLNFWNGSAWEEVTST